MDDLPTGPRNPRAPAGREPAARRPVPRAAKPGGAWKTIAAVSAFWVFMFVLMVANRDRLEGLMPETLLNTQLTNADAALAAGRLAEGVDSALPIYRAVLETDPDNARALAGINAVGHALLAKAKVALAAGQLEQAKALAVQARTVLQGGPEIDALDAGIGAAEGRTVEINAVLEQALAAQRAGRLAGGSDSAAALFQRALATDPASGIARKGLDEIAAALAQRAQEAIRARRWGAAEGALNDIERLRPGYAGVPELRAQLAKGRDAERVEAEQLVLKGEEQLAAGQLTTPPEANARASFEAVLRRDRANPRALAGLRLVGAALLVQAEAALEGADVGRASALIAEGELLGAPSAEVKVMRGRLREAEERAAIAGERDAITPEDADAIARDLALADAALRAGDLIAPPGQSAFDLYRGVLRIDRDNAIARAGLAAIPPRAKAQFDEAMLGQRLGEARDAVAALMSVAADDPDLPALRSQLAAAYLALAESQIQFGQFSAAGRSVTRARELTPDDPAIDAVAERVQRAAGRG
jgi:tetratricopeptide (TPR) repeat protein